MSLIPIVVQPTPKGERSFDIYSRLLNDRIIFLNDHINSDNAGIIIAQMLFLESQDPNADIFFYINSPGGEVISGFSILDTMDYISCDINVICTGQCSSMAAILLSNGKKGKRLAFPHSTIMIHKVSAAYYGKEPDIEIQAENIKSMNRTLIEILAKNCDKSVEQLMKDTDRDNFMTAKEACEYGLIDKIIMPNKKIKNLNQLVK